MANTTNFKMDTRQMYNYLLLKVTYGSLSPTKDFSSLKSMQYTAKASKNTIKTTTTTITNQSTSQQQQQQHFLIQQQQQHITAEEQQLQQQKIAKPNVIKTPATHTATSEENQQQQQQQQQQQSEEDVDPVISPTTKEEIAEKFIGGHSTPQVSMDPSTAAEVETSATPYNAAAPIPKQRSLFVAPIKLLSTEEPDSCTNSSATASPSPSSSSLLSATRLTSSSSSSPTATMVAAITKEQQLKQQKIFKGKVEKVEPAIQATPTDAELHEVAEEELIAETTTITTTKTSNRHTHTCGTYSSSTSTTSTSTPPPTAIVGKSTTSLSSSCGSSHIQSYSNNESEKSFTATTTTTFGTSALLSTTTAISKKFDIDKFEKSSPKISTKLQSNQFIKNQAVCNNSGAAAAAGVPVTTKYIKFRATQDSNDCSQTTKTTANAAIKKKMVAVQEMKKTTTNTNHHISTTTTMCSRQSQSHTADFDASEDLSYGPGIVSKLRCRYLSLALRESMEKQRHALDTLRRATSLNNLLDRDDQLRKHAEDDEDEDEEDANGDDVNIEDDYGEDQENLPPRPATGGILRGTHDGQQANVTKKTATFQKYASAANAHARMSQSQGDGSAATGDNSNNKRSRHVKRGNDSLKRARSVEALLCEKSPWNFAYNRSSLEPPRQTLPACNRGGANINVTIEDKINNARERLVLGTDAMPPRRLTSIIDDTERPPPDLVKQTLKKFEANANRRGRGVNRAQGNGDVASKVANYRSIIKEQKPAIVFPKPPAPPLSPTKKAAVKLAAKAPVLGAADLIGSPIGRKTAAVADTTTSATVGSPLSGGFPTQFSETSTPKQKLPSVQADVLAFTPPTQLKNVTAPSGAVIGGGVGLSENSPDIIPRHNINKLLSETAAAAGGVVVVDSPVTALTKKLEKLRIEADKQAQPQSQSQQQQHVIAKEFQAKPNQQQQQQQQQEEQQHDLTAGSDKFVGGDAALLAADKHHNSNGTRSKNNKNKSVSDDGGDSDKNTNDDDDVGDDSDEVHDDYDFVHDRCAEAESVKAGTGSASSDLSDDEYGTVTTTTTKRVSKKALDNIAKAGTSQEFKFATKTITTATTTELLKTTATGKQIGVIRPLHQLPASTTNTTTNSSSSSSSSLSYSSNSSNESFTTAKSSTNNNNNQQQQQQHMETLRNHQQQTYTLSHTNTHTINTHTHTHHHHPHPALTSREIEKNRINEMKKTATVAAAAAANNAAAATDTATAAHTTTATTSLDTVIVTGGSSSSSKVSSLSELDAAATITHNSSPLWALQTKKKRQPPAVVAENNSMVFNFSNRKEVPDYIENDGVVIRRKRELPKPNESGFVLLGDLSLETSTDSDYDDFSLCPPSPCDVEFENANIVIDGKSSIRQKPKEASFRVQFNDTLTSTFEYPSEASLVVDDSISDRYANENFVNSYENLVLDPATSLTQTDSPKYHHHHVAVDEIIPIPINSTTGTTNNTTPTTKMLGSLPLDVI